MLNHINMADLIHISLEAGNKILDVYESDFTVEHKKDHSPLTEADKQSHEVIVDFLEEAYPDIPILSEEGKEIPFSRRREWEFFWLVDPLDGTKEFVKRNGEFTVNIALVHQGRPVVGVIYAPVWDTVYFSKKEWGSYKLEKPQLTWGKQKGELESKMNPSEADLTKLVAKLPAPKRSQPFTVIASRSHLSGETQVYIDRMKKEYSDVRMMSVGSSLKLCMVAEGKADVYPRFAPTMEWDTAAGQAIVEEAGGVVLDHTKNVALAYNKENLKNAWFIAKKPTIISETGLTND